MSTATLILQAGSSLGNYLLIALALLAGVIVIVFGIFVAKFAGLWVQSIMARANIGFFDNFAKFIMFITRSSPDAFGMPWYHPRRNTVFHISVSFIFTSQFFQISIRKDLAPIDFY